MATAPLLAFTPPRLTLALAAAVASGAEVRPLLDVVLALERTVLTGALLWAAGASAAAVPVVVALLEGVCVAVVPVGVCLRAVVASVFEVPVLRRTAVPVLPLVAVPLPVLRFTWLPLLVVVPPVLRFTWAPVLPVLEPVLEPRRTWVEVLPEGAVVLLVAVLVERVAVEVFVL